MMRVAAFGATFLDFIGAVLPVTALDKAAVAHLMLVDDLPLVTGVGVLQHRAVDGWMIVGATVFGAPCTPRLTRCG